MADELNGMDDWIKNIDTVMANAPARIIDQLDKEGKTVVRAFRKRVRTEAQESPGGGKHLRNAMKSMPCERRGGNYEVDVIAQRRKAPHYHLVEFGHLLVKGNKVIGKVSGKFYFKRTIADLEVKITKQRKRMIKKVMKELT